MNKDYLMEEKNLVRSGPDQNGVQERHTGSEPSASFTPGPWLLWNGRRANNLGCEPSLEILVCNDEGEVVISKRGLARPTKADGKANARLIAAAPDLYEALKAAEGLPSLLSEIAELEAYGSDEDAKALRVLRKDLTSTLKAVRDALAKAEGK